MADVWLMWDQVGHSMGGLLIKTMLARAEEGSAYSSLVGRCALRFLV